MSLRHTNLAKKLISTQKHSDSKLPEKSYPDWKTDKRRFDLEGPVQEEAELTVEGNLDVFDDMIKKDIPGALNNYITGEGHFKKGDPTFLKQLIEEAIKFTKSFEEEIESWNKFMRSEYRVIFREKLTPLWGKLPEDIKILVNDLLEQLL